jgi:hypothetical protein
METTAVAAWWHREMIERELRCWRRWCVGERPHAGARLLPELWIAACEWGGQVGSQKLWVRADDDDNVGRQRADQLRCGRLSCPVDWGSGRGILGRSFCFSFAAAELFPLYSLFFSTQVANAACVSSILCSSISWPTVCDIIHYDDDDVGRQWADRLRCGCLSCRLRQWKRNFRPVFSLFFCCCGIVSALFLVFRYASCGCNCVMCSSISWPTSVIWFTIVRKHQFTVSWIIVFL